MALNSTQRINTTHLSEQACRAVGTMQYLLEKNCENAPKVPDITADNHLQLFIGGQEGFAQIATDLQSARKSIDLICWGFDPAMNLVRFEDGRWRQEWSFGYLLEQAAARGCRVRLLVWHNALGSRKQSNMPGYAGWGPNLTLAESMALTGTLASVKDSEESLRHDYCVQWYRRLSNSNIAGLQLLTRDGAPQAIERHLADEAQKPSEAGLLNEAMLLKHFGTHHQKTILIDHQAPNRGIGYVMGLNSVSDYWDSAEHLLDDPRRESGDADERAKGFRRKKPLQDYACRIEGGGALAAVNANFAAAWSRAAKLGDPSASARIAPVGRVQLQGQPDTDLSAAETTQHQQNLARHGARGGQRLSRVQVLRTQPEEQDKSIKAFYLHSSEVARDYLYIENQYFFYPEWAEHLKAARQKWVKQWQANRAKTPHGRTQNVLAEDMPKLHVMVVIPEPEIAQMVPRTYETMRQLGQEKSMRGEKRDAQGQVQLDPKTGKPIPIGQDVLMERAADTDKQYQDDVQAFRERVRNGQRPGNYPAQPHHSPAVQSARAIAPIGNDLLESAYGLKVSVAMLYTHGIVKMPNPTPGQSANRMAYRPIYIHSKLMLHSDACFTLGSANLNQRSMSADSEINIASDCPSTTRELRQRVFELHSGGEVSGGTGQAAAVKTFENWTRQMQKNKLAKDKRQPMTGFLLPFEELRECEKRYG